MTLDDIPEEDKALTHEQLSRIKCVHDWVDLYGGAGVDKDNPNLALATFFCKRCLKITIRSYDQSRFKKFEDIE